MSVIPFTQREVVLCPASIRADARRALAERLARLAEEIAHCRHRALEIEQAGVAQVIEQMNLALADARSALEVSR